MIIFFCPCDRRNVIDREIIEYVLSRKPKGSVDPSWEQVADELRQLYGFQVGSISGLRSRVAEYRKQREDIALPSFHVPTSELWGDGLAKLVAPATTELWETVVFVSDIHVPYHDAALVKATCELIHDLQPHRVVINGDTNDFFQLSRFNKGMDRLDELQYELDVAFDVRSQLRYAAPNAIIDETLGNHDERLITYVEINARSLSSLEALRPENLLRLGELEIRHHGRGGFRLREEFVVEHGHVARKDAGASAKARLNDTLISGIMGHVHRLSSYRRAGYRELAWFEQGCLCLKQPDYRVAEANWQPGIAVGHFSTKTRNFNVELVRALGAGFIYGGRHYGDVDSTLREELDVAHIN